MKTLLTLVAIFTLASLCVAAPAGDGVSVMNAFIATFAKDSPAWKTDITAISDPSNVAPGRQLGYSTVVGYYTFLPKTWDELTDGEKQQVYSDPRLKPFLISLRNYNNYPSLSATDTPRPAFPVYPVDGMRAMPYPQYSQPAYGMPMGGGYYPQPQPFYPQPMAQPYPQYAPAPMTYAYPPAAMAPAAALVQPIHYSMPQAQPTSRVNLSAEEMLLDRPVRVYMQR